MELRLADVRHKEQIVWVRETTKVIVLKVEEPDGEKYDIVVRFERRGSPAAAFAAGVGCGVLPHGAIVQEMTSWWATDTTTVEAKAIDVKLLEGGNSEE